MRAWREGKHVYGLYGVEYVSDNIVGMKWMEDGELRGNGEGRDVDRCTRVVWYLTTCEADQRFETFDA
jgi:hypothetical protein